MFWIPKSIPEPDRTPPRGALTGRLEVKCPRARGYIQWNCEYELRVLLIVEFMRRLWVGVVFWGAGHASIGSTTQRTATPSWNLLQRVDHQYKALRRPYTLLQINHINSDCYTPHIMSRVRVWIASEDGERPPETVEGAITHACQVNRSHVVCLCLIYDHAWCGALCTARVAAFPPPLLLLPPPAAAPRPQNNGSLPSPTTTHPEPTSRPTPLSSRAPSPRRPPHALLLHADLRVRPHHQPGHGALGARAAR